MLRDPQAPRRLGQRPLTGADQRDGFTTKLLGVRRARPGHGHHILPAGPDRPKRSSVHGPGGIPEKERLRRRTYATHEQARSSIFQYIEEFYNRRRLHSTLGYRSPDEIERDH
ncbi:MAG: IS3 family transposase, partial [Solirubrobacteraceae bacterium]